MTMFAGVVATIAGCNDSGPVGSRPLIRVALIESSHEPTSALISHLEDALDSKLEVWRPGNPADVVSAFERRELDMAFADAVTVVRAMRAADVVPLVSPGHDFEAQSYLVTAMGPRPGSGPSLRPGNIEEFRGRRISFGPERSAHSHWMGRAYLDAGGIDPTHFFDQLLDSASDVETLDGILDGQIDLGWVDRATFEDLASAGAVDGNDFHLLAVTPSFVGSAWVISPELPANLVRRLEDGFLRFREGNSETDSHQDLFLPVSRDDFGTLAGILDRGPISD